MKKQKLELEILLEPDEQKVTIGDDLAQVLGIGILYFDYNKYNIRYDAEIELQKVLEVMNKYPNMQIDIRSHTNYTGTYAFNDVLSSNRAKSREYLMDKGISPDRLTAKSYGEHQLVNNCECEGDNDVQCSEKEHQLNRRSEFVITKI